MRLERLTRAWSTSPHAAAALVTTRLRDALEDLRLGIWTAGLTPIEALTYKWAGVPRHAPTSFRAFRAFMSEVPLEAGRDVFVDLGCGKGRVLVLAAQYPFRRIVGVEISRDLAKLAIKHTSRVRRRGCDDVTIWTGSASEFPIPDDATVVYLFNPFRGVELTSVLDKLRASIERSPRRLQVIFNNPIHLLRVIGDYPWLKPRVRFRFEHECIIYDAML